MLKALINFVRSRGITACEQKALQIGSCVPGSSINIGCGESTRWPNARRVDHSLVGDFNTRFLNFSLDTYNLVICEQVIEHLHNTTWFLRELNHLTNCGGTLLLSTENLASLPNILALLLGKAPFSTQPICGNYYGGFRKMPCGKSNLSLCDPAYSGCHGHVRVMTKGQLRELLTEAGFHVLRVYSFAFNHYILFHCIKERDI